MNAQWLGSWDLGPRSHPNDGLLDLTDGDPAAGPAAPGPAPAAHRHPPAPPRPAHPAGRRLQPRLRPPAGPLAGRRAGGPRPSRAGPLRARRPPRRRLTAVPARPGWPTLARWTWTPSRVASSTKSIAGPTCCSKPRTASTSTPSSGYEETFAHDLLTGRHRGRGPAIWNATPTGSTPPSPPGPGRPARPSRCAASTTPCPGIGHACGHNIIAAAGLGAGLAAAAVADEVGRPGRHPRHAGRGGRRRQGEA